ncbi:hypothetical protein FWF48_01990 [Candidatus Saccharibacteria bacterium]|nr:hypothetical protein [Candidatus Saccharibacteria bacterium]
MPRIAKTEELQNRSEDGEGGFIPAFRPEGQPERDVNKIGETIFYETGKYHSADKAIEDARELGFDNNAQDIEWTINSDAYAVVEAERERFKLFPYAVFTNGNVKWGYYVPCDITEPIHGFPVEEVDTVTDSALVSYEPETAVSAELAPNPSVD